MQPAVELRWVRSRGDRRGCRQAFRTTAITSVTLTLTNPHPTKVPQCPNTTITTETSRNTPSGHVQNKTECNNSVYARNDPTSVQVRSSDKGVMETSSASTDADVGGMQKMHHEERAVGVVFMWALLRGLGERPAVAAPRNSLQGNVRKGADDVNAGQAMSFFYNSSGESHPE